MRRQRKHDDTEIALANFALTFAKALLVFCVILFVMINPSKQETDGVKPKIEYLITMSWPKDLDYDVDIWIRDPDGNVIYYDKKEVGFLNLERDDLGSKNNSIQVGQTTLTIMNNEELVSIRGFKPGEYVINAHLYSAESNSTPRPVLPFRINVVIQRMNPMVSTSYEGSAEMSGVRQEVHLVRFNLSSDGNAAGFINDLPIFLRQKINDGEGRFGSPTLPPGGSGSN